MLRIGSSSGGIGDNLIYTPIFNAIPTIFEIKDHPKTRNVAKWFEDLCQVKYVDDPVGCPQNTNKSINIIQKKSQNNFQLFSFWLIFNLKIVFKIFLKTNKTNPCFQN